MMHAKANNFLNQKRGVSMTKLGVLILGLLFCVACGKDDGSAAATPTPAAKAPLFRAWTADSVDFNLDFSTMSVGFNAASFYLLAGGTCEIDLIIGGDGYSGAMTIADSTYSGLNADPGCALLNGNYTYNATATDLVICKGADCSLQFN
jgi:hypothetical protein